MSYRNPTQVVDTQSGQHIRNLQSSVANTFAAYANTVGDLAVTKRKEAAQAIKDGVKKKNEESVALNKKMGDAAVLDKDFSTIDLSAFADTLPEAGKTNASNEASIPERSKAAFVNRGGEIIRKTMVDVMANQEAYVESTNLVSGTPGSRSKTMSAADVEFWDNYYKVGTGVKGSVKATFDPTKDGLNMRFEVRNEAGKLLGKPVNPNDPSTFPQTKTVPDIRDTVASIRESALADIDFNNQEDDIYSGSEKSKSSQKSKNKETIWGLKPNNQVFKDKIRKSTKAYVLGGLSAGEAIDMYNNMFAKSNNPDDLIPDTPNWKEYEKKDQVPTNKGFMAQEAVKEIIIDALVDNITEGTDGLSSFLKTDTVAYKEEEEEDTSNNGKEFYDKVRKDPVGFYEERTGVKLKYNDKAGENKDQIVITIPAETINKKEYKEKQFNMGVPSQRKDFYNRLLDVADVAGGNSKAAKAYRAQFEKALSEGTDKKTRDWSE